jgi:hypothetical protein
MVLTQAEELAFDAQRIVNFLNAAYSDTKNVTSVVLAEGSTT